MWRGLVLALAAGIGLALAAPVGAEERAPVRPGPKDKCPICGMFVARYPDWVAAVRFADGDHAFFDGAKDLFKFLLQDRRDGRGRSAKDVREVLVTDYYSLRQVDARRAFFVVGSDVLGPMGHELVPFAEEADAREFLADHRGRRILRFEEVKAAALGELD